MCRLVCNEGFLAVAGTNDKGQQVSACAADPCKGAQCPEHATCSAKVSPSDGSTLECYAECADGFYYAADGTCVSRDPCAGLECPANADCVARDGACRAVCKAGFVSSNNACVAGASGGDERKNPCAAVECPDSMICSAVGDDCIGQCKEGFVADGKTQKCVRRGAAGSRLCPVGYAPDDAGKQCFEINPCAVFRECPARAVCQPVKGQCVVTCSAGHGIDYITRTCQPLDLPVN